MSDLQVSLSSVPSGVRADVTLLSRPEQGWWAISRTAAGAITKILDDLDETDLLLVAQAFQEAPTLNLASDAEVAKVYAKRVAVYRDDIVALLEEAAEAGSVVRISGRKVDGGRYEGRRVQVLRVEDRRVGFGHTQQYLKCVDMLSDDARTFRVDGIERVEAE